MTDTIQQLSASLDAYVKLYVEDYENNRVVHTWAPPIDTIVWQIVKGANGTMGAQIEVRVGGDRIQALALIGPLPLMINEVERRLMHMAEQMMATPVVSIERIEAIARGQEDPTPSFEDELKAAGLQVED